MKIKTHQLFVINILLKGDSYKITYMCMCVCIIHGNCKAKFISDAQIEKRINTQVQYVALQKIIKSQKTEGQKKVRIIVIMYKSLQTAVIISFYKEVSTKE